MSRMTAAEVIDLLRLEPLAGEGGLFRQTWIARGATDDSPPIGTAILYLVTPESWSAPHRLAHDEVFHFYLGYPCRMVMASAGGDVREITLGHDLRVGHVVQHVVPAGWWQGTRLAPGGEWALMGTTMAPGFRPEAFELATAASLDALEPRVRSVLEPFLP